MAHATMQQIDQAVKALRAAYPDQDFKVLDWRDSGEGIRILPETLDPLWISVQDAEDKIPGMPDGMFLEPGYGSLGLFS